MNSVLHLDHELALLLHFHPNVLFEYAVLIILKYEFMLSFLVAFYWFTVTDRSRTTKVSAKRSMIP